MRSKIAETLLALLGALLFLFLILPFFLIRKVKDLPCPIGNVFLFSGILQGKSPGNIFLVFKIAVKPIEVA
ncbi:hypothetical protein D1AOALGA4SA_12161 [Olavius algarvensis Delta 1 endosymbiont]|nr:hypothetical protein D1AOALGA4SA_12161 [Olavius algarvensis Delta 1 endosymbiont]